MPTPDNPHYSFEPIGTLYSPYPEKFAVPRQPGLVTAAMGELHLLGACNREEILRGLEDFSHLWITFVFHKVVDQGWTPTVRPPRLGGNKRLGVFATRSPFRPNPLGLSVVKLEGIEKRDKQWLLRVSGVDMVNGTPVLDIKPYVPYVDAIAGARGGFTEILADDSITVSFSAASQTRLKQLNNTYPQLQTLIEQVLAQHPQPAYQRHTGTLHEYGMTLYDLNIRWSVSGHQCLVVAIEKATNPIAE